MNVEQQLLKAMSGVLGSFYYVVLNGAHEPKFHAAMKDLHCAALSCMEDHLKKSNRAAVKNVNDPVFTLLAAGTRVLEAYDDLTTELGGVVLQSIHVSPIFVRFLSALDGLRKARDLYQHTASMPGLAFTSRRSRRVYQGGNTHVRND